MEGFEEKIGAMLNNPQLMQQIMSLAQSMGQPQELPKPHTDPSPAPDINPAMIQQLMRFAGQSGLDSHQSALLKALQPYLSNRRLQKLEKAMRAAKLAGAASSLLGNGNLF